MQILTFEWKYLQKDSTNSEKDGCEGSKRSSQQGEEDESKKNEGCEKQGCDGDPRTWERSILVVQDKNLKNGVRDQDLDGWDGKLMKSGKGFFKEGKCNENGLI